MHKIDVSKGSLNSTVSNQWATRPDDQKFLSLNDLHAQVAQWQVESEARDCTPGSIAIGYDLENPDTLTATIGDMEPLQLTNFAFDQIAGVAGAPGRYLRKLPTPLLAANLRYGLLANGQDEISAYVRQPEEGGELLRGITSRKYGRIHDAEVVAAVQKIAGNGTGDTAWKVPGLIEWGSEHGISYNPHVDVTTETTTLYASDRDIFMFLVDDTHPIEIGKLDDGSPDLIFPGFYTWNSEVGARTFGLATMFLRGVCQNRNLWGVEGFSEVVYRHTAGAPDKFALETAPKLIEFTNAPTAPIIAKVKAAKAAEICAVTQKDDDDRIEFLAKFGFSKKQAESLIRCGLEEEGHKPSNVWDMTQAVTAKARSIQLTDDRVTMEQAGAKMMAKVG